MSSPPIEYIPGFVKDPDAAFIKLWTELDWERRPDVPRREYYCNDLDVPYTYGTGRGVRTYWIKPYHPLVIELRQKLEDHCGAKFEVCFLNGYENNRDHLGWHADNSPEMDDARPIGIISLGAAREIWFCPQTDKKDITKLVLQHGSLCIMQPGMQDTHYHRIPKASFEVGTRLSLTFRGYVGPSSGGLWV